ncbi:hypothetical protein [Lactobacillus sp. PV012]|uniref:hypothetical protein n=1 Tax=Lactobacillus sp. PV012 TaxID=2594494 RepID=UPI0022403EAC|nr:hypothetical protein [Lactobacillus sp. PV012]QNQ81578.1 hypothetical protein FP433_00185 [Lactobacillus sp. PV012]
MYKKILKLFLIFLNVAVTFTALLLFSQKLNNQRILEITDLSSNYTQIDLPQDPTSQNEYTKVIHALQKTSSTLDIPFLKEANNPSSNLNFANFSYNKILTPSLTYEVSNLSTSSLKQNFGINFKNKTYYQNSLPHYGNLNITVKPLTTSSSTFEGHYYIETIDSGLVKDFKKLLAKNINAEFHSHWSWHNFDSEEMLPLDDRFIADNDYLYPLLGLLIFQIIFFIIFCFSFSHTIGVLRLEGKNIFTIFHQLFLYPFIISYLLSIVFITLYLTHYSLLNHLLMLIGMISLFFGGEILLSLIIIFIFCKFSLPTLLDGFTYTKNFFFGLAALKGLILTLLLLSAAPVGDFLIQYYHSFIPQPTIYNSYGTFYPKYDGYNDNNVVYFKKNDKIIKKLYSFANAQHALYIDSSGAEGPNATLKYPTIAINNNYLKKFPLKNSENKPIVISEKEKHLVLLVPQKYKTQISNIQQNARTALQEKLSFSVIYIKNNQPIFSSSGKKLTNYKYIYTLTSKNYHYYPTLNIGTGDVNDPLKIPLVNNSPGNTYHFYFAFLKKNNLLDNYPHLAATSNAAYEDLLGSFDGITGLFKENLLVFILFLLVVFSTIYLYFTVYGKSSALKQTLGYSRIYSTRFYWIIWVIQFFVILALLKFYFHRFTPPYLMTFALAEILEALIAIISITIFSKYSLRRAIND